MSALALLYGAQAVMGAAQAGYGMYAANQARAQEALLRAQGLPKMQTPQEYFELYQNASRSRAFEQEKAMTESIMASNLNTLSAAGSRALIGAAPGVTLQVQRGLAGAAERDFQRQQQALRALADAEATTAGLNFQAESRQYASDLAGAQAGFQAGAETIVSGLDTALGAGALAMGEVQDERAAKAAAEAAERARQERQNNNTGTPTENLSNAVTTVEDAPSSGAVDQPDNRSTQSLYTQEDFERALMEQFRMSRTGGSGMGSIFASDFGGTFDYTRPNVSQYRNVIGMGAFAKGGSVTTPGKYTADHSVEYDVKTKGGKTIATVTGDETLVFNPEQRRFLKKVIRKLMTGKTIKPTKADVKTANKTLKAFKK